jgi:hypothetical protein
MYVASLQLHGHHGLNDGMLHVEQHNKPERHAVIAGILVIAAVYFTETR